MSKEWAHRRWRTALDVEPEKAVPLLNMPDVAKNIDHFFNLAFPGSFSNLPFRPDLAQIIWDITLKAGLRVNMQRITDLFERSTPEQFSWFLSQRNIQQMLSHTYMPFNDDPKIWPVSPIPDDHEKMLIFFKDYLGRDDFVWPDLATDPRPAVFLTRVMDASIRLGDDDALLAALRHPSLAPQFPSALSSFILNKASPLHLRMLSQAADRCPLLESKILELFPLVARPQSSAHAVCLLAASLLLPTVIGFRNYPGALAAARHFLEGEPDNLVRALRAAAQTGNPKMPDIFKTFKILGLDPNGLAAKGLVPLCVLLDAVPGHRADKKIGIAVFSAALSWDPDACARQPMDHPVGHSFRDYRDRIPSGEVLAFFEKNALLTCVPSAPTKPPRQI